MSKIRAENADEKFAVMMLIDGHWITWRVEGDREAALRARDRSISGRPIEVVPFDERRWAAAEHQRQTRR